MEAVQLALTDVHSLLLLLDSDEPVLLATVLTALTKLADEGKLHSRRWQRLQRAEQHPGQPTRTKLLSTGIVSHLVSITEDNKDLGVKKAAVACIAALSETVHSSSDTHPDFRSKRLITVLVDLLVLPDVHIQEEAVFALANIGRDFSMAPTIRMSAMKPLVNLLVSSDPDVKKNVAYALSVLLEDFTARSELRTLGGVPLLLGLCGSEYPEIQEHSLSALKKCARDVPSRTEMRKLLGHKHLLELASSEQCAVPATFLECLSQCLDDAETCSAIAEHGGVTIIAKLLITDDVNVKKQACMCLSKLAASTSNHQQLHESGVLSMLVNLLSHTSTIVTGHAALVIASMARVELFQQELHKFNALGILIQRLLDPDVLVKRYSVIAIASCCLNVRMRHRVRNNSECMRTILELLSNEDTYCVANAAECITSLCEDVDGRNECNRLNTVSMLINALKGPAVHSQASVCQALSRCLQEAEGRQALIECHGMETLIATLKSSDLETLRCAAWATGIAATSDTLAIEAGELGAYDVLLDIVRSKGNKAKFANDTLTKLLNYNLSAKYWVYGRLAPEDKIGEVFCDLGYISPVDGPVIFPILSNLQTQPVDQKHDILLVSKDDNQLEQLIQQAKILIPDPQKCALPVALKEIAQLVSQAMGGPIASESLTQIPYKFKLTEVKLKLQSNVVPLGLIECGVYAHRSLLFKLLCDRVGYDVSLVRGDYGRVWNEVIIKGLELGLDGVQAMCDVTAVVDVMMQPGRLLVQGTAEAEQYRRI